MNNLLKLLEDARNISSTEGVGSMDIVLLHQKLDEAISLIKDLSAAYEKARL